MEFTRNALANTVGTAGDNGNFEVLHEILLFSVSDSCFTGFYSLFVPGFRTFSGKSAVSIVFSSASVISGSSASRFA